MAMCVRAEGERCDAADNDCDGKIDENPGEFLVQADEPIELGSALVRSFTVASTNRTANATWITADNTAQTLNLTAEDSMPAELYYSRQMDIESTAAESLGRLTLVTESRQCWGTSTPSAGRPVTDEERVLAPPEVAAQACDFRNLDSALRAGTGLVAAVNGRGCTHGQLRVGLIF